MKKYLIVSIFVCVGIASALSNATLVHAQTQGLTQAQISSLLDLLDSFGASDEVINDVSAVLHGETSEGGGNGSVCHSLVLNNNLFLGSTDAATSGEVSELQAFLKNTNDFTYPDITGYFGPVTEQAVKRFQARNGIVSSGSPETTGYGVVGPQTREQLRTRCAESVTISPSETTPVPLNISLLSPEGGERFSRDENITVQWITNYVPPSGHFNIALHGQGRQIQLASGIERTQSSVSLPLSGHAIEIVRGTYELKISLAKNGEEASDSVTVYIGETQSTDLRTDLPDLATLKDADVAEREWNVGAGETQQIKVQVDNIGGNPDTAEDTFRLGLTVAAESGDKVYGSGSVILETPAAGEAVTHAFRIPAESSGIGLPDNRFTPGEYKVIVYIDVGDEVNEWDETNNTIRTSFTVVDSTTKDLPDLTAKQPTLAAGELVENTQVWFQTTVHNDSVVGTSRSFRNTFEFDIDANGDWNINRGSEEVSGIAAGGSTSVLQRSDGGIGLPAGKHRVRACADSTSSVEELDESNNCSSAWTFDVALQESDTTPLPDLTVGAPALYAGKTLAKTAVWFTATVENAGNADAASGFSGYFEIDVDNDGDWDAQRGVRGIDGLLDGASAPLIQLADGPIGFSAGTHRVRACVDKPRSSIEESNEANNCGSAATFVFEEKTVSTASGVYEGYKNGSRFIRSEDISYSAALENCLKNEESNPNASFKCIWEEEVIFSKGLKGEAGRDTQLANILEAINQLKEVIQR